jgi:hypothetical protein
VSKKIGVGAIHELPLQVSRYGNAELNFCVVCVFQQKINREFAVA